MYQCEKDWELGKVLKYQKPNPVGEDVYLEPDGSLTFDEDKIVKAQRIFLHHHYKPGGIGARRVLGNQQSETPETQGPTQHHTH